MNQLEFKGHEVRVQLLLKHMSRHTSVQFVDYDWVMKDHFHIPVATIPLVNFLKNRQGRKLGMKPHVTPAPILFSPPFTDWPRDCMFEVWKVLRDKSL